MPLRKFIVPKNHTLPTNINEFPTPFYDEEGDLADKMQLIGEIFEYHIDEVNMY